MDNHQSHPALATMALLLCVVVVALLSPAAEALDEELRKQSNISSSGCGNGKPPPSSLWVFGDSYADTGNLGDLGRELTHAWYDPYGLSFPGRPTGRFSDGRVLTDFIASAMGMPTPVAYKLRRGAARGLLARGMNFAVGGSGVLDTGNFQRNISAQIDLFQAQHPPSSRGCDAGVAVVVVSGNDYSYAADKDNSTNAAIAYIPTVVRRLREQLRRLRDEVGMRKVVVTNLHPMGCTPLFTRALNYSGCDPLANMGAAQHNTALQSVLAALDPTNRTFLLLDLNAPFAALVDSPSPESSSLGRFAEPRRPCCESLSADGYCGQQDDNGKRQYTLCTDPGNHFYWDDVHPTQAAWAAVAQTFRPNIQAFLSA
ncbi:GDSL esterase/lipase At5g03610-like [Phragmites australis]|uniref:GDSL esterase/lipase At5g03610-like n=1 Tax=Phragmites australis TaxID=29695 RepID=UPI002D796B6F|nr:GDSL esterase/lipase At5g03610-like [Phragmites australis]